MRKSITTLKSGTEKPASSKRCLIQIPRSKCKESCTQSAGSLYGPFFAARKLQTVLSKLNQSCQANEMFYSSCCNRAGVLFRYLITAPFECISSFQIVKSFSNIQINLCYKTWQNIYCDPTIVGPVILFGESIHPTTAKNLFKITDIRRKYGELV